MSRYDPAQHSDSVRVPREVVGNPAGEDGFPQDLRLWVDDSVLVSLVIQLADLAANEQINQAVLRDSMALDE